MQPIINMLEDDRATTGTKIGKDRACGSGDILADRHTDRQTHRQTYSSQYFATAPAGKVTIFASQLWRRNYNNLPAQLKEPIFALHFGQQSYNTHKILFCNARQEGAESNAGSTRNVSRNKFIWLV